MILNKKVIFKSADKKNSEIPPIEHVGENPLNPQGNCWKYYGCTCTKLQDCTETNQYQGISKRRRRKKENNSDSVVSEEEKKLLGQFRQQTKPNEDVDIGPL
jgi:hypothetical protein